MTMLKRLLIALLPYVFECIKDNLKQKAEMNKRIFLEKSAHAVVDGLDPCLVACSAIDELTPEMIIEQVAQKSGMKVRKFLKSKG
jgi:hypothetical protein